MRAGSRLEHFMLEITKKPLLFHKCVTATNKRFGIFKLKVYGFREDLWWEDATYVKG